MSLDIFMILMLVTNVKKMLYSSCGKPKEIKIYELIPYCYIILLHSKVPSVHRFGKKKTPSLQ